ncbi:MULTISPECIES: hypothetical protein [Pseudonocardia]|uniref:hypothetical protein n=1 Tax=Pseudonocardia TaxID=1847 RepID=UPI000F77E819|nr:MULTISPECIES: hypothetical protein [Pseudonocardia]
MRVDSVGGVGHWFVVHDPDATASLIEAVTADPPPHPAIVERRRRDAGRRNPLGFLRCQLVLVLLLIGGAAIRALEPGAIGIADVMIVVGTTLMAAYVLLEMWRYRRYRLTP